MATRSGYAHAEHNSNGLGMFRPQLPIRITVDQYPQFRDTQGYALRTSTPETAVIIGELY